MCNGERPRTTTALACDAMANRRRVWEALQNALDQSGELARNIFVALTVCHCSLGDGVEFRTQRQQSDRNYCGGF